MDNKISTLIQKFTINHTKEVDQLFKITQNAEILTKELPKVFYETFNLEDKFKVKGSVGNGNWSEIPWLAVLDTDITTSTTQGYYFVILFDKSFKNFYIALAVGYTQFEREFGITDAKKNIKAISAHYAGLLKNLSDNFSSGPIKLDANNNLGKGYELGTIVSKKYSVDNLSDSQLIEDIKILLGFYDELKSIVGDSILNLEIDSTEYNETVKTFRKKVANKSFDKDVSISLSELIDITEAAPPEVRSILKSQIVRNKKFADFVKNRESFICEICKRKPFLQRNGKPYAEADHVIPLGHLTQGVDHPDNMRCLCSQCHSIITHGSEEEIKKLLS